MPINICRHTCKKTLFQRVGSTPLVSTPRPLPGDMGHEPDQEMEEHDEIDQGGGKAIVVEHK